MSSSRSKLICLGLLVILVFGSFYPCLDAEFLNWDDEENVVFCPQIRHPGLQLIPWAFTNFTVGDFKPLVWPSYALEYAVWGLNPRGYHLDNLLLHALNSCLVFLIIMELLKRFHCAPSVPAAFLATLFFSLHPLRVESVAWISERKGLLCALFYLLTVLLYLKYLHRGKGLIYVYLSALAALLSKPLAVTLPLVLLLLDLSLHREGRWRKLIGEKVTLFILAAAAAAFAFYGQISNGALIPLSQAGIPSRAALSLRNIIFYLGKTFFPYRLSATYPALREGGADLFLIPLVIVIAGGVYLWRRERRLFLIGGGWFLLTILPVIGIFRTGLVVAADRFTYLPAVGISILLSGIISRSSYPIRRRLFFPALSVITVGLIILTHRQCGFWHDSEGLWRQCAREYPDSAVARSHYGQLLYSRGGQDAEAIRQLRAAWALIASTDFARGGIGFAVRSNLARALARTEQLKEAEEIFREILKEQDNWVIHHSLAGVYSKEGRKEEALAEYEAVLKERPGFVPALCDYGLLLAQTRSTGKAIEIYRRALRLDPKSPRGRYNLSLAYLDQGRKEEGISRLQELAEEYPKNQRILRALLVVYQTSGEEEQAARIKGRLNGLSDTYIPYSRREKPGFYAPIELKR